MNTIVKKFSVYFLILSFSLITLSSCLMTKTEVGGYAQTEGKATTYAKGKQIWLFWGLIPVGRTNVNTPDDGNCAVITKFTFGDVLISGLTGGLLYTYTIKVKVKKTE